MSNDLEIAEIPYENGAVRCRYARYLSNDRSRWIRHGLYLAYHPDGSPKSEGAYEHGLEKGLWRDFHPNGQLAAEGMYEDGVQVGEWHFWAPDGQPEQTVKY